MASTRSWCAASIISTLEPERLPERAHLARSPPDRRPSGGVRMHQRLTNSVAKPASGPDCSVPATGWAGTRCDALGQMRRDRGDHRALDRADVGDDRARLRAAARSRARSLRRRRPARRGSRDRRRPPPRPRRRRPRRRARAPRALAAPPPTRRRRRCCAPAFLRRARAGDRRADQADADDARARSKSGAPSGGPSRSATTGLPAMKSASAATTPRLASSVPTVRRRQSGRP